MASLPSNTFLVNYNAKNYNPTTHTISKTQGQLFDNDMVLNAAVSTYTDNSITLNNQYFEYTFSNVASNIFRRTGTEPLTIIAKIKKGLDSTGEHCLFSCRISSALNYLLFNPANNSGGDVVFLHNNNNLYQNCPYITITNEPNIFAIRVNNGNGYGISYTDNQTFRSISNSWGNSNTNKIGFFTDTYYSGGFELWRGEFYWIYISTEALTDEEITQVIKYNEGGFGIEPDTIIFPAAASSSTIDVTSDNPWTAATQDSWITVSPSTGNSDATVTVSVSKNNFEARNGTVTFTDSESNEAELSVSQDRLYSVIVKNLYRNGTSIKQMYRNGECIYRQFNRFYFSVDVDSLTFDYTGGSQTINITASDEWSMTLPNWLTASSTSGLSSKAVTITAGNYTGETQMTGNIVITCGNQTKTISVTQNPETPPYEQMYLTFEIISGGTIGLRKNNSTSSLSRTISYSINEGSWTDITSSTGGTSFNVSVGDKVRFKGTNSQYATSSSRYNYFYSLDNVVFKAYGNIMSMIGGDDFTGLTTFTANYTFINLFYGCTGLTDASNLILPATTLAQYCYYSMFSQCSSLVNAPELPATTLAQYCYYSMFNGCTALTRAPELPATTLAGYCYEQMFYACHSLTTAPSILPATTLANRCYRNMFNGCWSLNYIKCLATDISANACTDFWLEGVSSTGTFVKNPSMTGWSRGTSGIPKNWTIQDAT